MKFEKFIEDIIKREKLARDKAKKYADNHADHPAREYHKLYRELPQNKIRIGYKK